MLNTENIYITWPRSRCDRIHEIQQQYHAIVCLNKGKQKTFSLAH